MWIPARARLAVDPCGSGDTGLPHPSASSRHLWTVLHRSPDMQPDSPHVHGHDAKAGARGGRDPRRTAAQARPRRVAAVVPRCLRDAQQRHHVARAGGGGPSSRVVPERSQVWVARSICGGSPRSSRRSSPLPSRCTPTATAAFRECGHGGDAGWFRPAGTGSRSRRCPRRCSTSSHCRTRPRMRLPGWSRAHSARGG